MYSPKYQVNASLAIGTATLLPSPPSSTNTVITNSGLIREVQSTEGEEPVFIQSIGFDDEEITAFLKKVTVVGRIPEPLRIARLVAMAEIYE